MNFRHLHHTLIVQTLLTGIAAALVLGFSSGDAARQVSLFTVYGSLLVAGNFTVLYWVWFRFFTKKKIAPLVTAVVSKYAILGLVLWSLNPLTEAQMLGFAVGVIIGPLAVVLYSLFYRKLNFVNKS